MGVVSDLALASKDSRACVLKQFEGLKNWRDVNVVGFTGDILRTWGLGSHVGKLTGVSGPWP